MTTIRQLSIWFILIIGLASCGGGDTGNVPPPVQNGDTNLTWTPPVCWADNTPLQPEKDISRYDGYIDEFGSFDDNSAVVFSVSGVDNTGRPITSFNLRLLSAYGIHPPYYVSLKSVSLDNATSKFSDPAFCGE